MMELILFNDDIAYYQGVIDIPTPTPIPLIPLDQGLDLPEDYVYQASTSAIQMWNTADSHGAMTLFQASIVLALIFIGLGLFLRSTRED